MKIKNLHQPYIFKHDGKLNLIVSEFMPQKLYFKYGESLIKEDYWKLFFLDSNFHKTIINTPETILYDGEIYHVIQECNGFINKNKISYVIGGHTKEDYKGLRFFLVEGDFDFSSKKVDNVNIRNFARTGFINGDKFTIDIENLDIIKNSHNLVLRCSNYLDNIVRIIPVCNKNHILITGEDNEKFKTLLFDIDNNELFILEGVNSNNIYKSSIYDDGEKKLFAYTEKVFTGEFDVDYELNIYDNYLLKKIQF